VSGVRVFGALAAVLLRRHSRGVRRITAASVVTIARSAGRDLRLGRVMLVIASGHMQPRRCMAESGNAT
jgi:hypothetical protein